MRCISLWQPWASLMAHGLKRVETRKGSWGKKLSPGPLLIHAAQKWNGEMADLCHRQQPFAAALASLGMTLPPVGGQRVPTPTGMPFGAVVGVVNVLAVVPTDRVAVHPEHERMMAFDGAGQQFVVGTWEKAFGDYTDGRVAVVTNKPLAFADPVPFDGRQSLFDVPLDRLAGRLADWLPAGTNWA